MIIIVGNSRSGKSTYADTLGLPVLRVDDAYCYQSRTLNAGLVIAFNEKHGTRWVLDGYPLRWDPHMRGIGDLVHLASAELHILYRDIDSHDAAQRADGKNREDDALMNRSVIVGKNRHHRRCAIKAKPPYKFIYSHGGDFTEETEDHFLDTNDGRHFLSWLDAQPKHDYQSCVMDGETIFDGYSGCEHTWQRIKPLVKWDAWSCAVLDVGCNYGYFSMRISERGAWVLGIDSRKSAIEGAKNLAEMDGSGAFFAVYDICKYQPEKHDVALCLNMLHRVYDINAALTHIFNACDQAIFEVNQEEVPVIADAAMGAFTLVHSEPSHKSRPNRIILHYLRTA